MSTPNYKLHYFDVRGRGELIRMIFAEKGIPFEDIRVTGEEWETLKTKIPGGQLPFLEVDGDTMYESLAIARYLAREYDLYGDCNRAMQLVDEIIDSTCDVMTAFYTAVFEKDEEQRKTKLKDVYEKNYAQLMARMEKKLEANESGFLVGSSDAPVLTGGGKPEDPEINHRPTQGTGMFTERTFDIERVVTIADFFVYNVLCNVINKMPNMWDNVPKCKEHFDKVANLPNIKAWIDKHPRSEF